MMSLILALAISAPFMYTFDNGVELIVRYLEGTDIISCAVFVEGGVRNITEENMGIEDVMLKAMVKEAVGIDRDSVEKVLTLTGTMLETAVRYECSILSFKTLREYADLSLPLLTALIRSPSFDSSVVEEVKGECIASLSREFEDPDGYIWRLVNRAFFEGHPYARLPSGSPETVKKFTPSMLRQHHKCVLKGKRLLVVFVGDITPDRAKEWVGKTFGDLPAGDLPAPLPDFPFKDRDTVVVEYRDIPATYIVGKFDIPSMTAKDYPAIKLGMRLLSQGMKRSIRTGAGISYSVWAGASIWPVNYGYVYISSALPDSAVKLFWQEVSKLEQFPPSTKEMRGALNVMETWDLLSMEDTRENALDMGIYYLFYGDPDGFAKLLEVMQSLTPEDVRLAMRKYLDHFTFGVLGKKGAMDIQLLYEKAITD